MPVRPLVPGSVAFVALIAAILTMSAMTIDINLPAIPATALAFGASETEAQLTVSVFFLGFAVGQAFFGPLADRFGRRPLLIIGILAYLVATLVCALAPSIEMLLGARLVQGLAAASGPILGRAVIRDRFEGAEMARITSFVMAAFVMAPVIAPSIGALILAFASWRWIFGFLACYGAVLLVLVLTRLDESLARPDPGALRPRRIVGAYRAVLAHPDSRRFGALSVLGLAMLIAYLISAAPIFMTIHGLSPSDFGMVFAAIAVCSAIGSLVNTRLVRRFPLESIIRWAFLGASIAMALALALAQLDVGGAIALVPLFGLFFLCFSVIVPNATAIAMLPHATIAGAATSALGVAQSVIPAVIGTFVAAAGDGTARPAIGTMLALALLGLWLARRPAAQVTSAPS